MTRPMSKELFIPNRIFGIYENPDSWMIISKQPLLTTAQALVDIVMHIRRSSKMPYPNPGVDGLMIC